MNRRFTLYGLAAAGFFAAVSCVLFLRASSVHSALREPDGAATLEQITEASARSNFWFIVMMFAIGIANIFLAQAVAQGRKEGKAPAA